MPITPTPFAKKKFVEVLGRRMAVIDEGEGDAIVFQHGNPTSSYLWRNVMPHCRGLGRLVACDLIGMGDSDKLEPSGPQRYTYAEQREFLFALWDALGLGNRVVLVLHDWGSALGFDWANRHRERVQGIAYMESIVMPLTWADWAENARPPPELLARLRRRASDLASGELPVSAPGTWLAQRGWRVRGGGPMSLHELPRFL